MNFRTTTHDHCIHHTIFEGVKVLLLHQTDDFAILCPNEDTAKKIYDTIGQKLQLPLEYFGLIKDFNGIDVDQTQEYIQINCSDYIDRVLTSRNWQDMHDTGTLAPLPEDSVTKMYAEVIGKSGSGPREGTSEHAILEKKIGFSYQSVLGELMYVYVTCQPDIGYAVTTLSKFSSFPINYHYTCLRGVVQYLSRTKKWGICYHRTCTESKFHKNLDPGNFMDEPPPLPDKFPSFPAYNPAKLTAYTDAAYGNNPCKRCSTTGFAICLAGGAVVFRSKTQKVTALSSIESEFFAAVSTAKVVLFL